MIFAAGWISVASADEGCLASAQSDLERLYCEVVERGGGAGLPSMVDFKRNDPKVQALLLRQPAKRLSLTLPEVSATPEPGSKPELATSQREPAKESRSEPSVTRGLAGCLLRGEFIQCPKVTYELEGNRSLASLDDGVLEPRNRLGIVPFDGGRNDDEAVRSYLSAAYDRYILKMLAIGLGANTMSFTAFHNAFQTLENSGVDFSKRMGQTYELLKQDRKTLGVKARYHDELPENLSMCETVDRDVIVCDNVGINWVFVRAN
ncbi:hypothetical protein [Marinobacter sp. 1_MG-2023]|uniref:hypothetical protein n=1 Tax=Marinobacter sp. 1_MG-2023 TaxID=3062627 RepID=UPI0026E242F6|nr:hypothetical protein [Marinobacter sp. 1_MG-2023]MDO6822863.1 hypothetical protein [Marinobacter sp. 1_MG-2023]